jgi:D-serine deaminase-like pyridoxal phosphate-dependent protein
MKTFELDTPAVLVDAATLRSNIQRMQRLAAGFGVRLRPHVKTHKSPEIARLQLEAGAAGITVAKLGEAEVMVDAGLEDILIANQIVGEAKARRLRDLATRARIAVLVDSEPGLGQLEDAFRGSDTALDVLIEVDTGKARCGLSDVRDIAHLAARVADATHVRLRGVETHEGHVPVGARGPDDLRERALEAGRELVDVAEALRANGHDVEDLSVGSTPAAPYTASVAGITEMRPGTYIFNDVNQMAIDQATPADCALSILATVISRPAQGRAVLDAGSKSLFAEPARRAFALPDYDGFGYVRESPETRIANLSEEHAVVDIPAGVSFPAIGEKVRIIPNHVCPAVNLHEQLHIVEGGEVVAVWPIAARGRCR